MVLGGGFLGLLLLFVFFRALSFFPFSALCGTSVMLDPSIACLRLGDVAAVVFAVLEEVVEEVVSSSMVIFWR